jgi:hypothetical protein
MKIILFFVFLFIFYFLFDFELDFKNFCNIISNLNSYSYSGRNIIEGSGATVNISNPKLSTSFSKEGINSIAAALSYAGGATIGFKVAQYVGGSPLVKVVASLGTMAVVQGTTAIMCRVLNNSSNSFRGIRHNFVCILTSENDGISNLNDYPLNLLFDINILLYGALLFMYIILNINISRYLLSLNYNKFIPKNSFGNMLSFLINRYLKL